MKIKVLGCAGSESPGRKSPAFLVDDGLLLDAGIVGGVLSQSAQERIHNILITHAHHDHVRGLPSFADNLAVHGQESPVTVRGPEAALYAIRNHIFNGLIWPDFSRIPTKENPVFRWQVVTSGEEFAVDGYAVTAFDVHHSVPTVAYRVQRNGCSLLYTGDMGPTPQLWGVIGCPDVMIVEVSFPNQMEDLSIRTGHLTAELLKKELALMPALPSRIFVSHIKPFYEKQIHREVEALGIPGLSVLHDGQEILIEK